MERYPYDPSAIQTPAQVMSNCGGWQPAREKKAQFFIMWEKDGVPHYRGPFPTKREAEETLKEGQASYYGPDGSTRTKPEFPEYAVIFGREKD